MSKDRISNLGHLLGIDTSNDDVVRDLAAVAITRLAWRDGPIEDWHAAPHQKINDVEMMRANVATTRLVRHVIDQAPELSTELFRRIGRAIANERRQLPDGFRVEDLAPRREDLSLYRSHIAANVSHWIQSGVQIGSRPIMQILACRAALNWGWWLSTGYPAMVEKFTSELGGLPSSMTSTGLRSQLLGGPDRMDYSAARFCLRASFGHFLPQDCGLPPKPRRLERHELFRFVDTTQLAD